MNFISHYKTYGFQPLAHTEGRLKSYDSCLDVRAWSHDKRKQDRYLREWIKCDMPLCVFPINTLIAFFSSMTCRNKGRTVPRCHPECKSKAILESITASCDAIRECLKAERNLAKYFCEEDFETSHWPCEKSLEALKNIKLFWKIILEKEFAINLTKAECSEEKLCICESVRTVARNWERDMVQQALFVKSLTPQLCQGSGSNKCCKKSCLKKSSSLHCSQPCCGGDKNTKCTIISPKCSQRKVSLNCANKSDRRCKTPPKKSCHCVMVKVKTEDACIGCVSNSCEVDTYRASLNSLYKDNSTQKEEIERLKQENCALKNELINIKSCKWNAPFFCATALIPKEDNAMPVLKPIDSFVEDKFSAKNSAKGAESEILITMKHCKNESFKYVSLLQVLHKTNDPWIQENYVNEPCYKNEDPIELLTKVQVTLGAMVKREMSLAKTKRMSPDSKIEASFERIGGTKPSDSELSCRYDDD